MMVLSCISRTQKCEAGESCDWGLPGLHREFQTCLDYKQDPVSIKQKQQNIFLGTYLFHFLQHWVIFFFEILASKLYFKHIRCQHLTLCLTNWFCSLDPQIEKRKLAPASCLWFPQEYWGMHAAPHMHKIDIIVKLTFYVNTYKIITFLYIS